MSRNRKALRKIARKGRPRTPRKVTLPALNGDHGTGTAAAIAGTIVVPIKDSPNRMATRKRINALDRLIATGKLTMPEQQAAEAIQDAYARVEALSSGGPLKEQVQSSPKPDAAIAAQVDVMSHWQRVTKAITKDRAIIDHVCCYGQPLRTLPAKYKRRALARLRFQLVNVAVHMNYATAQDIVKRVV